jgi:hypothetical protein
MTNDEGSPNAQMIGPAIALSHHSGFVIPSSFVILSFVIESDFPPLFPGGTP